CQCLFVAPCSHTWHYKCIRSLLASPQYPIFICPNCRAAADLEAEVEDPEEWEQLESEDGDDEADPLDLPQADVKTQRQPESSEGRVGQSSAAAPPLQDLDQMDVTMPVDQTSSPPRPLEPAARPINHTVTEPVPIPVPSTAGRPVPTGATIST